MLDNKGDTGLFTMDRHDDPAVWSDVRLTEQSHFATQHLVCQIIHDDVTGGRLVTGSAHSVITRHSIFNDL